MTRSPFGYPAHRGDAGGGDADLQTDVMRFMAILSLCLVAIFALVQSIPPAPPAPRPAERAQDEARPAPAEAPTPIVPPVREPEPVAAPRAIQLPPAADVEPPAPADAAALTAPLEPVRSPAPSPIEPAPEAMAARQPAASPPPPATPAPQPEEDGFTLRFESDQSLRRLVARNEVGLYAIGADKAVRMSVNRGALSFWPASTPRQFHEMHEDTVPAEVIGALRRSGAAGSVTWGVTLPPRLTRELDRFLREYSGGMLVIDGSGAMRRETPQ